MTYETFRHAADSYGLLFLVVMFGAILLFLFRRGSTSTYRAAARLATDAPEHLNDRGTPSDGDGR